MSSTRLKEPKLIELSDYLRSSSPLGVFSGHVRLRWYVHTVGFLSFLVCAMTDAIIPKGVQWTVDLLQHGTLPSFVTPFIHLLPGTEVKFQGFFLMVGLLIVALLGQTVGRRYWRISLGQESHKVGAALKDAVWERARFLPFYRLDTDLGVGPLMSVAVSDVSNAQRIFGWTLGGLLDASLLIVCIVGTMLTINVELSLITLVLFSAIPFLTYRLARREFRLHLRAQRKLSRLNDRCAQAVGAVRLLKLTGSHAHWISLLLHDADAYRKKRVRVLETSVRFIITVGLIPLAVYATIFLLGLGNIANGSMSLGAFVAFLSAVLLLQGPFSEAGFLISEWQRGIGSLSRILEVLQAPSIPEAARKQLSSAIDSEHDKRQGNSKGILLLESVTFRYPLTERAIVEKLSLTITAGERLGIAGTIGSGKSTLLRIIAGLEPQFDGEILVAGRDIRTISRDLLTDTIGIVAQRPFLFASTVRDNLCLDESFSDDELWRILQLVELEQEIRSLPSGLHTGLGEVGVNLSGGQRQRLTLARALLRKPQVLLLDDCLSAVDTVTEQRILSALDKELANSTVIWAAHRDTIFRYCSRVLLMPQQTIVGGTSSL